MTELSLCLLTEPRNLGEGKRDITDIDRSRGEGVSGTCM